MSLLSPKKLILLGFAVILLIAIPLTVYLVQRQQELRGKAAPSTIISFVPESATTQVGQTVNFDISVNPGTNQVSFVKLAIAYDPTKLKVTDNGFVPNTVAFPTILQEPAYDSGSVSATLSVGADPTKVIQTITKIATVTFEALAQTESGIPTRIIFDNQTQVLSIGSGDVFNENVLSTTNPASVTITAGTAISPTATPTMPIISPTATPALTPTATPRITPTSVPTPTQIVVQPTNQAPSCTALTLDQAATGTVPYTLAFTAVGNDTDGTISKVSFSFGDGISQDETQAGGIGTNAVNVTSSHTYSTAGTFTATATLTDDGGAVSNVASCTQNITVNSAIAVVPTTPPPPVVATQIPTVPPTGPRETIIGIGAVGVILTIIGGLLLFIL